jgi:hypothetical protein
MKTLIVAALAGASVFAGVTGAAAKNRDRVVVMDLTQAAASKRKPTFIIETVPPSPRMARHLKDNAP